jgi:hypothetical protein
MKKLGLVILCIFLGFFCSCTHPSVDPTPTPTPDPTPKPTPEPETNKKVVYVPLDDRPVNTERAFYLLASLGYDAIVPDADLYQTHLDNQRLNSNQTQYGDCESLITWLEAKDADGYVLSLDQMLSGGLVNSRVVTEADLDASLDRIDRLVALFENKTVVVYDTVMRLASTVGYQNAQMTEYNKLRQYGSTARETLTGDRLTISNIIAGYKYDANHQLIATTLEDSMIDSYLSARSRKLRIASYFLDKVKNLSTCYTYIGVDDSSPATTIQTNEIAYLKAKLANGTLFSGTDELGLMSITHFAMAEKKASLPAKVTYIGGGENAAGDSYDIGTLKENLSTHLNSLNVTLSDTAELQILVLTQPKSLTTSASVTKIMEEFDKNTKNHLPTILIDASSTKYYGAMQPKLLEKDLSYLVGYSNWNTVGNAIGIALCNGLSRYLMLSLEQNTEKEDKAFLQTLTFGLLKDISYKITGQSSVKSYITTNIGDVSNFYSSTLDEEALNSKLKSLLFSSNYSMNMPQILNIVNSTSFVTNLKAQTLSSYYVSATSFSFPWYRTFEIRFAVVVENAE